MANRPDDDDEDSWDYDGGDANPIGIFGKGLLWTQLVAARADLGDERQQARLADIKREQELADWRAQEAVWTEEVQSMRATLAKSNQEYDAALSELRASEIERSGLQTFAASPTCAALSQRLEALSTLSANLSCADLRRDIAEARLVGEEAETSLHAETERCRELRQDLAQLAATTERLELASTGRCNDMQSLLQAQEEASRRFQGLALAEEYRAQEIGEEAKRTETSLRGSIEEQGRKLAHLRDKLGQATAEVNQRRESQKKQWTGRFARQLEQRDDRNILLQRRLAEATLATRNTESSAEGIKAHLVTLRSELQTERSRHSTAKGMCADARKRCEMVEAETVAAKEKQDTAKLEKAALVTELRRIVQARKHAARDASERALRADVDALRSDVAREARWLQEEMHQVAAIAPARASSLAPPMQLPMRATMDSVARSIGEPSPPISSRWNEPRYQDAEFSVGYRELSVKGSGASPNAAERRYKARIELEEWLQQLERLLQELRGKHSALVNHVEFLRDRLAKQESGMVNAASRATTAETLAATEQKLAETEAELQRVEQLHVEKEAELSELLEGRSILSNTYGQ
eukprot:TRINITY_DN32063_c0_g1_i1.p1 TRINITY_DN32063_c0_g1~~TRINITY_DN32063_c0_g1_i1.p1  ORF type:complete len:604 (-),score=111.14 TRINITY_DN32063_c0_g1_i1:104-1855(-)